MVTSTDDKVVTPDVDDALWVAFAAPLRAFIRKRVPASVDPEDVLQDVFLRMTRHRDDLAHVERLDAWVYQVARTALADALRSSRRRVARTSHVDADDLPSDGAGEDEASALLELSPCLTPFVQRLEEPYRSALQWTALEGLTQQDAAVRAGITLSGMKSRVQRAREQLRRMFVRCCELEVDARGGVMDFAVRDPSVCGPRESLDACSISEARPRAPGSVRASC